MDVLGSQVLFRHDRHLVRVDYMLKSSSGTVCDFYVWDAQGLKICIASTFYVGLWHSIALRGSVPTHGENK